MVAQKGHHGATAEGTLLLSLGYHPEPEEKQFRDILGTNFGNLILTNLAHFWHFQIFKSRHDKRVFGTVFGFGCDHARESLVKFWTWLKIRVQQQHMSSCNFLDS